MPVATEETGRAREMRLRRVADARGLRLSKLRRGSPSQRWVLSDSHTGKYIFGSPAFGEGKTLDEVERYLAP